uniref:DAGKc domain-containing protein n=1 Tax=Meleagris gallopavo TaxID=9103 RepID=G3USM3_MELGA
LVFATLRNHWKKTTFGVCLLSWGGNWLYGKHCDNLLRRAACLEAQVFGNELIPSNMPLKKATVFLNPAACKGKARNLFEKNAAPILHLSGLDVNIVTTDYEGQAKKLMELMENTDLIIIAGGDGTVQEVVTGLLRRADEAAFSKIPIGFIPLGKTCTLSHTLYPESVNQVHLWTEPDDSVRYKIVLSTSKPKSSQLIFLFLTLHSLSIFPPFPFVLTNIFLLATEICSLWFSQ